MDNVNGGFLQEEYEIGKLESSKVPSTIDLYINQYITKPNEPINIEFAPSSLEKFYLFYNGVLLYPGNDYTILPNNDLYLKNIKPEFGDHLYGFEIISGLQTGCFQHILRKTIDTDTKKLTGLSNIEFDYSLLIFYDGKLLFHDQYDILTDEPGTIKFVSTLEHEKPIDILQMIPDSRKNLEIIFSGNAVYNTTFIRVTGVRPEYTYLVFYDGKLMTENVNYTLQKNLILFKDRMILDVNKKLVVVRV